MRWCQLYLFMSIISIFSKTRNVYFVNVLSFNVRDFDFSYRAFWPGFCDKWNKPFLLFDMFFFIYIYTVLFFLMNELSYWISFPFRFILLLRRTMFVELDFHRRLGISQFLDCPRVSDEWKNRRYSRLPRMGSDISVNSGAFSIFLTLARFPGWSANIAIEVICESFSLLPILLFLGWVVPSAVHCRTALQFMCILIVGIHASGISVLLPLSMLLCWSLMRIASLTLRVYQ